MVINLYSELTDLSDFGGDMIARLKAYSLYYLFAEIAEDDRYVDDNPLFNKVLFWILHCYSRDSKKNILGADWTKIKRQVAEELEMPLDITELKEPCIQRCVFAYLEYQSYRSFKHIMVLREQYEQMLEASLTILKKGEAIDYKMKYDCGVYADHLLDRIRHYEQKLKDDLNPLAAQIDEIETINQKKIGTSISVDTSEFIKD